MKKVEVAGAVIVSPQGDILCALRSARMTMPGLWEFPGGKIEAGEDPRACLRREIEEELGCDIEVGALVADHTHRYPATEVRLLTYYATVVAGTPTPHEHERLLWLPLDRLAELEWAPADVPTLDRLRQGG